MRHDEQRCIYVGCEPAVGMLLWRDSGLEACEFVGTFEDEKSPALGEASGGRASGVTENPVYDIFRTGRLGS
jgi:hypothetical protein